MASNWCPWIIDMSLDNGVVSWVDNRSNPLSAMSLFVVNNVILRCRCHITTSMSRHDYRGPSLIGRSIKKRGRCLARLGHVPIWPTR